MDLYLAFPGRAALVEMFTRISIKNWAAVLESSETHKNLKGFEGGLPLCLWTESTQVRSVKTKVIVNARASWLLGDTSKQRGALKEVNLVGLLYLVSHLLSIQTWTKHRSPIFIHKPWLGSPVLSFENVPNFLYSALHLLKFNLFNAKQDLERVSH